MLAKKMWREIMNEDIFEPYLKGEIPSVTRVISEVTLESENVIIKKVLFESIIDTLHGGLQNAQESLTCFLTIIVGLISVNPRLACADS
jgi:hypothetical protein